MRACMCAPVQSHAGHQRGTTFTPSPCSALGHSWAPLRPLEVSGAGTHQVCQDRDQGEGGSATCQPPRPQVGAPDGSGWWVPAWVPGQHRHSLVPPRESWAGWGLSVGRAACALLPASDSACPLPRGHLCDGLSTEKQQSNPGRALLGCQLPFL